MSRGRAEKVFIAGFPWMPLGPGRRTGSRASPAAFSAKSKIVISDDTAGQRANRGNPCVDGLPRVESFVRTIMVRRNEVKKRRGLIDRAEDSTIGGEWRNASGVPKEETASPRTGISIPYCAAQCKVHSSIGWTKGAGRTINGSPKSNSRGRRGGRGR